jgi:hypothetical protein
LQAFLLGIKRVYYFQFADNEGYDGDQFGNCGLVDHNATPKPAYYTLQGLVSALSVPGNVSGGSLTYSLNRGSSALFQRGDGSYAIVVWNPVQTYCFREVDECSSGPVKVAALPATLAFAAPHTVSVTTFSATTGMPSTQHLGTISSTSLSVTPVVQVVSVSPNRTMP